MPVVKKELKSFLARVASGEIKRFDDPVPSREVKS
jgi:hypothetical protein